MRVFLAVLLLVAVVDARPSTPGFDVPLAMRTAKIGMSELTEPPAPIEQECLVFRAFAMLSVSDPGIKGGTVRVRDRSEGLSVDALCAPGGDARLLGEAIGYGWGAMGDFVFARGPDAFGVLESFEVYRASTGKRVLEAEFDDTRPFVVAADGITFHRPLKVPCVPAKRDQQCWKRIRAKNGIPEGVRLRAPDCARALKEEPKATPRGLQITAPVRVSLERPEQELFLDGEATCALAP